MTERDNLHRLYQTLDGETENVVITLLTTILERQDTFLERIAEVESKLDGHMGREENMIAQFVNALPIRPDGKPDVDGHRDFHTALIDESKARAQMWRELRIELMKKGLWGLLAVLGFLVLYWWNGEVKK